MNISYMKYAVAVAEAGTVSKAAETLLVSAPNLSRDIKSLEEELGITIFERSSRGMSLTPDGEEFIAYAKKILDQMEDLENMYRAGAPVKKKFSVSVPRASYISDAFVRFSESIGPGPTEIYYRETNSSQVIKDILTQDSRLGILRYAVNYDKYFAALIEDKGLASENLARFRYVLVMGVDSPLASKEEIRFSDLQTYIEIAHADPFVPYLPISSVKKEELPDNIDRRIFVYERGSQFELLSENPETFMWVSPLPRKTLVRYGLVQRECAENLREYRDMLIRRKNYVLTDLDKQFIAELYRSKRRTF